MMGWGSTKLLRAKCDANVRKIAVLHLALIVCNAGYDKWGDCFKQTTFGPVTSVNFSVDSGELLRVFEL